MTHTTKDHTPKEPKRPIGSKHIKIVPFDLEAWSPSIEPLFSAAKSRMKPHQFVAFDIETACSPHSPFEDMKASAFKFLYGGVTGRTFLKPTTKKETTVYKTQKAKGISAIRRQTPFVCEGYDIDVRSLGFYKMACFPHTPQRLELPAFARPCPTTPRHGFVESRRVETAAEAMTVVAETLKADPNGEVLFLPELSGKWSGVITHAGVTFGLKNDGATAGHSARTVPAYSDPEDFISDAVGGYLCECAGITQAPYAEFVEDTGQAVFVQLRDGPTVPRSRDYIPTDITVELVITTNGEDLLEWEALMAKHAGTPGLIVHHPNGSLTSHYAVHCILHKIPVILDEIAPPVGTTLPAAGWEPEELQQEDYEAISSFLARRMHKGFSGVHQHGAASTAVATLHSCAQWGREEHLLRLRAEGVAAALIFTATACIGEARHWYYDGPGRQARAYDYHTGVYTLNAEHANARPQVEVIPEDAYRETVERDSVYSRAFSAGYRDLMRWTKQAAVDFSCPGWGASFGGRAWADAADITVDTGGAVDRFIEAPSAERWNVVMSCYNRLINACHNNGKVLTKWIDRHAMDRIAIHPGPVFVNPFAAEVSLGLDMLPTVARERKSLSEFLMAA